MFGDDVFGGGAVGSADERDDADRARDEAGSDGGERSERWYAEQRPPHHDR